MYARLRQKITLNYSTIIADTGSGTNAFSVLLKDIAKIITGQITSAASLNPTVWDIANSEVVGAGATGWVEYQSNYLSSATNIAASTTTNSNMIYLRCASANTTPTSAPIYKYTGIGLGSNVANSNTWQIFNPWATSDFLGNPTLVFRSNSGLAVGNNYIANPFITDVLTEYVISSSSRGIVISATLIGSAGTHPGKIVFLLEYQSTAVSSTFNLPNQIYWELSTCSIGGRTDQPITTATGAGTGFDTTGYNIANGYNPSIGSLTITAGVGNWNSAYVYTQYFGSLGFTSLWSAATGTELSTLKPAAFTAMSNTVDSSGNIVGIPVMPLMHFPAWDSVYDMSSLSGVYATKTGLGANGDSVTINGVPYAYINASTMGYLVPKQ